MTRFTPSRRPVRPAFTLIELLVVVAIIALLVAILLPSLKKAREQAKDTVCRANLHALGIATAHYAYDNQDRLIWIPGAGGAMNNNAPFHQYYQILRLYRYNPNLKSFICPMASSSGTKGRYNSMGGLESPIGPRTVKGYAQGTAMAGLPGPISYYSVLAANPDFFMSIQNQFFAGVPVNDIYTEYWFNDWNAGATGPGGVPIPAISGNSLSKIRYPAYVVMYMDAIDWNPRHSGGNNICFVDAHVDRFKEVEYFDPDGSANYANSRDRDAFGNRPYWCWGLGQGIVGDN